MIDSAPVQQVGDLVVDRLSWRPHGRREPTLREVDLRFEPHERVLLVGASGSGKSTLLRAMAGLLDESLGEQTGTVRLGGQEPQTLPGAVGLLLQDPTHSLVAEYAGRDAAFGPENRALPRAEILDAAARSLAQVGFPYSADHSSIELSGGEMQRLALAGSLALNPSWLLLDEPTAMLDPEAAAQVREAVRRVVEESALGLIVVEHRLDGWIDLCKRLIVLDADGTVLADGPLSGVLAERTDELVAAGIWVPNVAPPVVPSLAWPPFPERVPTEPVSTWPGPVLSISDLSIAAPGGSRHLVDGLQLSLGGGEAAAVSGPSGAGKSTLLRTVAGMHAPVSGQVRVVGSEPGRSAARIGWVPQHSEQIITRPTVRDEVLATSRVIFADRPSLGAIAEQRADAVLAGLGLSRFAGADPYQLSGGEQRRVALATAVVHRPDLLLLDEPTVGQDRHTWAAVRAVIAAARAEGSAVMTSTHDEALLAEVPTVVRLVCPSTSSGRRGEGSGRGVGGSGRGGGCPSTGSGRVGASGRGPSTGSGRVGASGCRPSTGSGRVGASGRGGEGWGRAVESRGDVRALSLSKGIAVRPPDYRIRPVIEPGAPVVARCNPLSLLIIAVGAALGSFFVRDWLVGLITLLFGLSLAPLAVTRIRPALLRLIPVGAAALTVGWSTLLFSRYGWFAAAAVPVAIREVLRIACLVVPGALVLSALRPSALGDALAQRLHAPHRVVLASTAALLRLDQLKGEWRSLAEVRRVRGLAPGRSLWRRIRYLASMTVALLVWMLRSAQQLAVSMDARGFAGATRRTFALDSPWRGRDWFCCLLALIFLALPIVLGQWL